jgi:hypothetical protein
MEQCGWRDMRKSSTDRVWGKHMSRSFIYGCEKEEMRWRESRMTACGWIREVERRNTIGDGTTMGIFGKAGYKEGWRLEMKLGVS